MATRPRRPTTMRTRSDCAPANRHEIDQRDRAGIGFPFGLEDERIGTVAPLASKAFPEELPLPFSAVPRSAAKQAGESKRGRHSQSIEPSLPTSAALWQSPISA